MVSKKYRVLRSRVYFGEVVIPHKINSSSTSSEILEYKPIRYSLFELTQSNEANDLLNKVPNYQVADYKSDIELEELCIAHSLYLGQLLEYLQFSPELTYKDLCYIRNLIFSEDFSSKYPEVFGILKNDRTLLSKEDAIISSYYLRVFDKLGKNKLSDVLLDDKERVDPFKRTMLELKKKLWK